MMFRTPRSIPLARNFLKDRRGGVLIYVAIALPVFLGISGLAVDVSVWHAHKRHIQTIADAGAVAGASELVRMIEASNRNDLADTAAREDATASGAKVSDQITVNIPPTAGDYAGATNAVEVIVTRDAPSLLSRLVEPRLRRDGQLQRQRTGRGAPCHRRRLPQRLGDQGRRRI
jgi:Flp pilus assembly protein TadG